MPPQSSQFYPDEFYHRHRDCISYHREVFIEMTELWISYMVACMPIYMTLGVLINQLNQKFHGIKSVVKFFLRLPLRVEADL